MANTVLIDANSIGRAAHAATKLTVGRFQTQAIYNFLRTMSAVGREYRGWNLLVLWDGRADHRYAIYPDYKGKRKDALADPEKAADRAAYDAQVPFIKKSLEHLAIPQMTNSALEADDLAGYFVPRLTAHGHVQLITGDSDWLQLVNERCSWFDPRNDGKRVTHQDFFQQTGFFSPREYLEGKALIGDTSDSITPAGGIGEKGAPEFMAQFRSMAEFWRQCDAGEFVPRLKAHKRLWQGTSPYTKEGWEARFQSDPEWDEKELKRAQKKHMDAWPGQARANWTRNMRLMNLLEQPHPDPTKTTIVQGALNEEAFQTLCDRLVFASIRREYGQFIEPFRERWATRQQRAV